MFNQITLAGRLGQEPELRYTQNGKAVVNGTLAVPRGRDKETDWIRFTVWGKTAELLATWSGKGKRILISGELHIEEYEDKDGNKRSYPNVNVQNVRFIYFSEDKLRAIRLKQKRMIRKSKEDDEVPF